MTDQLYFEQASLSVYPEAVTQEPGLSEMSIKQESLEHGAWPGPTGSPHSGSDLACRSKRIGGSIGGEPWISALKPFIEIAPDHDTSFFNELIQNLAQN